MTTYEESPPAWYLPQEHPGHAGDPVNFDRAHIAWQRRGRRPNRTRPHLLTLNGWWLVAYAFGTLSSETGESQRNRVRALNRAATAFADRLNDHAAA